MAVKEIKYQLHDSQPRDEREEEKESMQLRESFVYTSPDLSCLISLTNWVLKSESAALRGGSEEEKSFSNEHIMIFSRKS